MKLWLCSCHSHCSNAVELRKKMQEKLNSILFLYGFFFFLLSGLCLFFYGLRREKKMKFVSKSDPQKSSKIWSDFDERFTKLSILGLNFSGELIWRTAPEIEYKIWTWASILELNLWSWVFIKPKNEISPLVLNLLSKVIWHLTFQNE